jgi:prepilin-type processing-associated H-X9-DG protein
METQASMFACPDVETGTSYGMNNMGQFIQDDVKIYILDYTRDATTGGALGVVHPDNPTVDSCDVWDTDKALRHSGTANVLYSDGHVESQSEGDIDPCTASLHDLLWLPKRYDVTASTEEGTGQIQANYFAGANFDGVSAQRIDNTLSGPFGASFFGLNSYNVPSPVSDQFPGEYKFGSGIWTGKIKANYTEPYTFWLACDNNARVYINGSLVVERQAGNSGGCPTCVDTYQPSSPINMNAEQWVTIRVELQELGPGGSPSHVFVQWESPSTARGDIPPQNLKL